MAFVFESVEMLLGRWKTEFRHGVFTYRDPVAKFRSVVAAHFGSAIGKAYGVYVVRREADEAVLYIGKGGTISDGGRFKGQDVPGRLRNVRGGDIGADHWFRELLAEVGPLVIEYLILVPPVAPAYVEAVLLQSYLVEFGRPPLRNAAL